MARRTMAVSTMAMRGSTLDHGGEMSRADDAQEGLRAPMAGLSVRERGGAPCVGEAPLGSFQRPRGRARPRVAPYRDFRVFRFLGLVRVAPDHRIDGSVRMTEAPPPPSGTVPSQETASPGHPPRLTGQAVSDLIGFSSTMLRKLEDQGFAKRGDDKLFDVVATLLGYIRWLKDDARRSSKTEGAKAKEAEQVRRMRIETAKILGQLVEWDEVEIFFTEAMTELRNIFGGIPAGLTRDPELRALLEKRLDAGFDESRAAFEKLAAAVRDQRPLLDDEEDPEP